MYRLLIALVALSACSAPPEGRAEKVACAPDGPLVPPPAPVVVETCASFQGRWGMLALNCPDGTRAESAECTPFGGQVIASQATANQYTGATDGAWTCQGTIDGVQLSICLRVTCVQRKE